MINTSNEFKDAMLQNNTCISKATIVLKNGTTLNLDTSSIMQNGVKLDDGTSSAGAFDIGAAVINKLTLTLNNMQDAFSDYDLTDAVITVWIGKQLSGRVEWLKKGVFNAEDPKATPSVLTIEALDNMEKFDRDYDGKLGFPKNLQSIVQYCCDRCEVLLNTARFDNDSFIVTSDPFTEKDRVTYRELLSYCAQIAGCYARCNVDGRLELKWYDRDTFGDRLDGGSFDSGTPSFVSGGAADGGNFKDYASGDSFDGGSFTSWKECHHIYATTALEVSTDDVVITGIQVTAADKKQGNETSNGETVLYGTKGYVLEIQKNPFVAYGRADEVATYLGKKIVGMQFRKLSASCLGDPSIEAGDAAFVSDRKGNTFQCYITNLTYTTGSYERITNDAETPSRNTSKRYSEVTKAIIEAEKNTDVKLSKYDLYAGQMNELALNAMGYYQTVVDQSDGSRITYMHDKPVLTESRMVYKMTIDGFFMSKDGGKTYSKGIDKDGNAVMNTIAAIGIIADYINTRGLKAVDNKGKITFEVDAATGEVKIDANLLTIKSESVVTGNNLDSKLSNYPNTEQMNAEISLSASGLKQEFNSIVSGVMSGNNNMLTGTSLRVKDYIRYKSTDGTSMAFAVVEDGRFLSGMTARGFIINNGKGTILFNKNEITLKAGRTYTASVTMQCVQPTMDVSFGTNASNGLKRVTITQTLTTYNHTFTPTVDQKECCSIAIQINEDLPSFGSVAIQFGDMKLTESDTPTAWSPSAADLTDELDAYSTTLKMTSAIQASAAGIKVDMNKTLQSYYTGQQTEGKLTGLSATLTSQFNASIAATAESLTISYNQKLASYATIQQMNTAIQVSASGISATISSQLSGGSGKIQTSKYVLDAFGMAIYNGGFRMYKGTSGQPSLYLDTTVGRYIFTGQIVADTGTFGGALSAASGKFCGNMEIYSGSRPLSKFNTSGMQFYASQIAVEGFQVGALYDYYSANAFAFEIRNPQQNGHLRLTSGNSVAVITGTYGFMMQSGQKSRAVQTDYGTACITAYETPEPSFGDYGGGTLDENGECSIFFDPVFMQTVSPECGYQVFLQKYGPGDLWVAERQANRFSVKGTPGLAFGWNAVLHQKGYELDRAEIVSIPIDPYTDTLTKDALADQIDYEIEAYHYLQEVL